MRAEETRSSSSYKSGSFTYPTYSYILPKVVRADDDKRRKDRPRDGDRVPHAQVSRARLQPSEGEVRT
jgi:hypothetical protein